MTKEEIIKEAYAARDTSWREWSRSIRICTWLVAAMSVAAIGNVAIAILDNALERIYWAVMLAAMGGWMVFLRRDCIKQRSFFYDAFTKIAESVKGELRGH